MAADLNWRTVELEIVLYKLDALDFMNENFTAEFHVTSIWKENQELTIYENDKMWSPKLYIKNEIKNLQNNKSYDLMIIEPGVTLISEKWIIKGFKQFILSINTS